MKKARSYTLEHVKHIQQISENGYLLHITFKSPHTPGQVVGLRIMKNESPRLYSIAGSRRSGEITILFTEKPNGQLTPRLSDLQKDDVIFASAPFGTFLPSNENAWWICNGTGIAPFVGLWESMPLTNIKLVHGAKNQQDLYFHEDLKDNTTFDYYPCCSQEDVEDAFYGRVTHFMEQQQHLPQDANYYLCGSAEMSVDVRDILISKQVPYQNIHTEIYF